MIGQGGNDRVRERGREGGGQKGKEKEEEGEEGEEGDSVCVGEGRGTTNQAVISRLT